MKILKEIFRDEDLNIKGRAVHREAVRGVALRQGEILMVYSPVNGDYKFPGGGLDNGESDETALAREIQEECGAQLAGIDGDVGCVIEYSRAKETDYDLFKMTSRYYLCSIHGGFGEQQLDRYEQDLGFRPVWVNIDAAIDTNSTLLRQTERTLPAWTSRETFILKYLKTQLLP